MYYYNLILKYNIMSLNINIFQYGIKTNNNNLKKML